MGLDYRERWHTDVEYRRESFVSMRKTLNKRFPTLNLGGDDPDQVPGTVSIAFGTPLLAGIFGLDLHYMADNWLANAVTSCTDEQAAAMEVPVLEDSPVFQDLMRQMDEIEQRYGQIEGVLDFDGALNTAFRVRGQDIFVDMITDKDRAYHVLNVATESILKLVDAVHARQIASGVERNFFVTSNCVVNMLSGEHYEEFVLPCDQRLGEHFDHFGVHNCAWDASSYLDGYAQIDNLAYLDFGIESDLVKIRRLFPQTRRCLIYTPMDLKKNTVEEFRRDLNQIREELSPCEIILADIDVDIPDSQITIFYEIAAELWQVEPAQLVRHRKIP